MAWGIDARTSLFNKEDFVAGNRLRLRFAVSYGRISKTPVAFSRPVPGADIGKEFI